MSKAVSRKARIARHARVRAKISGSRERPRLAVFRSSQHIYAQVIDDDNGNTLVAASTLESEVNAELDDTNKTVRAAAVGQALAKKAVNNGIKNVVFDRGGYKYHGRVKALAEAARKSGLKF